MAEDTNYITEVAMPLSALLVSIAAVFFTWKGLKLQRTHNIKSLKPFGKVSIGDYESNLFIKIDNLGVGPLILKSISVNGVELSERQTLLSFLNPEINDNTRWKNFTGFLYDRVIPAGGELDLINWAAEKDRTEKTQEQKELTKRQCREHFKDWNIRITYTDIYDSEVFSDELSLSWFGRNL